MMATRSWFHPTTFLGVLVPPLEPFARSRAFPAAVKETKNGSQQAQRRQWTQGCSEEAIAGETTLGGATAWTKRSKKGGEFMAVKKPAKKAKAAKKFKGVWVEKKRARAAR
ncbi:hypothetical protein [Bradyrhizobium sp. JYMT SZCCT0180]|uniref:hypothetical protein n=1 Tax=Bradyrhizobium sp. JYMT SZCCT0180 TaxID=2807666 RepID=UPI001BA65D3A|nr:hypothetical protein [Bradyrhizobium sp. JYMT SZCCT0180]MBR1211284.1 hypothetical protein [Bradyrhizobium sp. JYMT SZCCT0180]